MIRVSPATLALTAMPAGAANDALVPVASDAPVAPVPTHRSRVHNALPLLGVGELVIVPDAVTVADLLGDALKVRDAVGVADRDGVNDGVCIAVGDVDCVSDGLTVAVGDDPSEGVGEPVLEDVGVGELDAVGDDELDAAQTTLRNTLPEFAT